MPSRSVVANLMLGQEPARCGVIDWKPSTDRSAPRVAAAASRRHVPLDAPLHELTLSQQQLIAIARALLSECRVLIMDEPTAALNSAEVEALFKVLADVESARRHDVVRVASSG